MKRMKEAAAERGTRPCTGLPMPMPAPPRPAGAAMKCHETMPPPHHAAARLVPPPHHTANSPRPPPVPLAEREPTLHIPDDVLRHLRRGDGTLLGAPPPLLQPLVLEAAAPLAEGCNRTCWRLMWQRLQPLGWRLQPHVWRMHPHVCSRLHSHPMACACAHGMCPWHVPMACAHGMCMCMCPGEHPRLCESAIVCVAAHRGGHGQTPLQLPVLGLMLGHVLGRPHAAVLAALVPRFSGVVILPRLNQLSDGERRLRLQAADLAACNAVRQRLQAIPKQYHPRSCCSSVQCGPRARARSVHQAAAPGCRSRL